MVYLKLEQLNLTIKIPLFCFWNARMFPLKQDLTHPCLANKRGLNDTTFTICCSFARTWVSDSNFTCAKLLEYDKEFQNISSIYLNCYNKLQPNLWRRLYHLPQLTDFASLVPPWVDREPSEFASQAYQASSAHLFAGPSWVSWEQYWETDPL